MKVIQILFVLTLISCSHFQKSDSNREISSTKLTSLGELEYDLKNIQKIVDQSLDIYLNKRSPKQLSEGFSRVQFEVTDRVEFKIHVPIDEIKKFSGRYRNRKRRLTQLIRELHFVSTKRILEKKEADKNLPRKIDIQFIETITN